MRLVNRKGENIRDSEYKLSEETSEVLNPQFKMRVEVKQPHLDPTLMVIVLIWTVDRSDMKVKVIGFSLINLFLNRVDFQQPSHNNELDCLLMEGDYQLDIIPQQLPSPPLSIHSIKSSIKLPCSSLLLRIRSSHTHNQPPPPYTQATYNNSLMRVSQDEIDLFNLRINNKSQNLNQLDFTYIQLINQHNWMQQQYELINLKFINKYDESKGVKISLDGIIREEKKSLLIGVLRIWPSEQQIIISNFNWESDIGFIKFNDGFKRVKNEFKEKSMLVIEIKEVKMTNKVEDMHIFPYGWTVLPIVVDGGCMKDGQYMNKGQYIEQNKERKNEQDVNEKYINSGSYHMSLYAGQPSPSMLTYLSTLASLSSPSYPLVPHSSIFLRLVDFQRLNHFHSQFDFTSIDNTYLFNSTYNSNPSLFQKIINQFSKNHPKNYNNYHNLYIQKLTEQTQNKKQLIQICPLKNRVQEFNQLLSQNLKQIIMQM